MRIIDKNKKVKLGTSITVDDILGVGGFPKVIIELWYMLCKEYFKIK